MEQKMGLKGGGWQTLIMLACVPASACGGGVSSDGRWEPDALAVEASELSNDCEAPGGEPTHTADAGSPLVTCVPALLSGYGYAESPNFWLGGQSAGLIGVLGQGYLAAVGAESDAHPRFSLEAELFVSPDGTLEDGAGRDILGYPSNDHGTTCLGALRAPATVPPTATRYVTMRMNLDARSPLVTFDVGDPSNTSNQSVSFSVIDSRGEVRTLDIYFSHVDTPTWAYHAVADGSDLEGGTPGTAIDIGQGLLTFTRSGALGSASAPPIFVLFAGGAVPDQALYLDFGLPVDEGGIGLTGATGFASTSEFTSFSVDGSRHGTAAGVAIGANGLATLFFDNGTSVPFGELSLARFPRERELAEDSDGTLLTTLASGAAQFGVPATPGHGVLFYPEAPEATVETVAEAAPMP